MDLIKTLEELEKNIDFNTSSYTEIAINRIEQVLKTDYE